MEKIRKKAVMIALSLATIVITFFACKKSFHDDGYSDNNPIVTNAKSYLGTLVNSENVLLDMPYNDLKRNANLRRFARIGKLSNAAKWSKAKSFYQKQTSYTIVPVNEDVHQLSNKSFESVRYLLFHKRDNDKIEMNIIEMYSKVTLGTDIPAAVLISAENLLFNESKTVNVLSASVIFYDRFYYNSGSYEIINGAWKQAKIIVENSPFKPSINRIQVNSVGRSNGNDIVKATLSSVSPMSGCFTCSTYYLVGIWSDNSTGEVISVEILGSWDECTEVGGPGLGSPPGSTGNNNNNSTSIAKEIKNNLNNDCLSGQLNAHASNISSFIGANSGENLYRPSKFNFSENSSFGPGKTGELVKSYLDNDNVLNFDIQINSSHLPNYSKEMIFQTYLHESLHGVMLTDGRSWNGILQHEELANAYRNSIQSELRSTFPNLSSSEAEALSWAGIQFSQAYINLPRWKKTEIENKLADFQNGNSGTYC